MPRLLTMPTEPLARFRLLALWFAEFIAILNVALFVFVANISTPLRWESGIAAALLAAWWFHGYRRGGISAAGWLVEVALVTLVSAWSPMPLRAIGVFYVGIQFRALYVNRQELVLLAVSYAAARILSLALSPDALSLGAESAAWAVQIVGLTVIAVTLHLFAEATRRHGVIEHALLRSEERYRLVSGATRDVVYDWNVGTGAIDWTESLRHIFGYAPEAVGADVAWWLGRVHPSDRESLERTVSAALSDRAVDVGSVGYRVRRADDSYAYVSGNMVVQRDAAGTAVRVVGSIRDVTAERELESQFRQSQKMEAVGQLAGGVAHDFNNLLTVIGGHVFILEQSVAHTPSVDRHLAGITQATERAAALTKQLLAFSRKQMLKPSVLDVNAVVGDVFGMMRPVIGEHLQIVTRCEPNLLPVFADAGQLGQVLVNLALNARDAMPDGGTLTVTTENTVVERRPDDASVTPLPPGEYVRLVVRDTGVGMDQATLARVFEPFFTTKAVGQGSGLGLATVYGIIKQSFGDIEVTSTPGAGSSFSILLPVTHQPAELPGLQARSLGAVEIDAARERLVLLVEDDDDVREFAREVLTRSGYRVRTARNGVDALDQIHALDLSIDVVVTDVVMPEMGGRELVEHLRRWRPDLPVLYITGYTADSRMLGALYATEVRLLGKPFTAKELETAVREVTEARKRGGSMPGSLRNAGDVPSFSSPTPLQENV